MTSRKPDDLKKILFEEPPRADMAEILGSRLQDVGVHSALAEPTARFVSDLCQEGLRLIRLIAPAVKNPDAAPADLAFEMRQCALYLEQCSGEAMTFLDRVSAFLDRKVEEDDDAVEAFEKSMTRLEKLGKLEDPGRLVRKIAVQPEVAATHGSWAMGNVYLSLVKLAGIVELLRFERVSPTTVASAMAEIQLDLTHRLQPGLSGTEEGRIGLLEMLTAESAAK